MSGELLATMWQTIREYIPSKDRQTAADHLITELIEQGIDDEDLAEMAIDRTMRNAIMEHIDLDGDDDEEDE